jgi:ribose transport system ATP-binding protein
MAAEPQPAQPVTPVLPADPVLDVTGVSKTFPGVRALHDVSLRLRPGRVHALVGENGAGKSTLIKVMTGVYRPDGGQIALSGQPVSFEDPVAAQKAGVSTIYQEVNLIPLMSVARNLFLGREPRRFGVVDVRRMNKEAAAILTDYGVRVDVSRPLRTLGLGAQQMVAIARAVQIDARVVIMDEPTSSLERREVRTLFEVIERLRATGIAVLYVSHRLDELYAICHDVTVLRDGAVVHTGELAELDRLRLVSLMLGRDMNVVRREGVTAFTGDHGTDEQGDRPEPVLRVRELSLRNTLHGISLDIAPGEVLGLGGLLGSGRSETAKAIAGGLRHDEGTVEVSGHSLRRNTAAEAVRAGVVMLPEDRKAEGVVPNLSVRQNIVLAALPRLSRFGLVSRRKQDELVDYFMDRLRIKAASPEQKVGELSGGNQQKVLLARWLCLHPKVLLLDEPTRGIDVGAKAEVQKLIDELASDGLGVLLISSELEELIEGSDRIAVLRDGRIVARLTGDQVDEQHLVHALATEPVTEVGEGEQ